MSIAILLALSLVAITFTFHYRVLLWLGLYTPKMKLKTHTQVLVIVLALFVAHLVEVGAYALVYEFASSALGLGDIQPIGHVRFITAIEALNGFMLITWSASFTFLAMGRLWPWQSNRNSTSR